MPRLKSARFLLKLPTYQFETCIPLLENTRQVVAPLPEKSNPGRAHPPDVDRPAQNEREASSIHPFHPRDAGQWGRSASRGRVGAVGWAARTAAATPAQSPPRLARAATCRPPIRPAWTRDVPPSATGAACGSGHAVYKSHTHGAVSLKLKPTSAKEIDKAERRRKKLQSSGEERDRVARRRGDGSGPRLRAAARRPARRYAASRSRSRSLPVALVSFCSARSACSRSSIRGGRG